MPKSTERISPSTTALKVNILLARATGTDKEAASNSMNDPTRSATAIKTGILSVSVSMLQRRILDVVRD